MNEKEKSVTGENGWQDVSKHDWRVLLFAFAVLSLPILAVMIYAMVSTQGERDWADTVFILAIPAFLLLTVALNLIAKNSYWKLYDHSRMFNAKIRDDVVNMVPMVMIFGLIGLKPEMTPSEAIFHYFRFIVLASAFWLGAHWVGRRIFKKKS